MENGISCCQLVVWLPSVIRRLLGIPGVCVGGASNWIGIVIPAHFPLNYTLVCVDAAIVCNTSTIYIPSVYFLFTFCRPLCCSLYHNIWMWRPGYRNIFRSSCILQENDVVVTDETFLELKTGHNVSWALWALSTVRMNQMSHLKKTWLIISIAAKSIKSIREL